MLISGFTQIIAKYLFHAVRKLDIVDFRSISDSLDFTLSQGLWFHLENSEKFFSRNF